MIFQTGVELNIKDRKVQAVIDLETGLIGFTELVDGETKEYFYLESPVEFRMAFLNKIETLHAESCYYNFKIYRKNKEYIKLNKTLLNKGEEE